MYSPKLWKWYLCLMGAQDLDCINVVPPEKQLQDPYHQEDQGEERPDGHCRNFFLPNVSCSLSIPPSHSLFLFLPVSHLLVNEMCSIDFGLWYHLHLNLSRDITYNWIITLMQQFSNLGHVFLHSICPSVCDTIIFS